MNVSTRTLTGFVDWVRTQSFTDPNPDARAAFERVLDKLSRIDSGEVADIVEATAPKPLPELPRDYPICDVDLNTDGETDWRDAQRARME